MSDAAPSFLARNEFLIRRLHSLSGLIPVGAYMVVHLTVNASVLNGPGTFQSNVYRIHSLGRILPLVEWLGIFLPILFHAIVGVVIVAGAMPNTRDYPYQANLRYSLQRWTGMIAFLFIVWHVAHMHGWFHNDWWLERMKSWGGAQFAPYNATSTAGLALQSGVVAILYAIGILSCVYHLANGIWTMGITWGVWVSPHAQAWAGKACAGFGVVLAVIGLSALVGVRDATQGDALQEAINIEDQMYEYKVSSGEIPPNDHKRAGSHPQSPADAHTNQQAVLGLEASAAN